MGKKPSDIYYKIKSVTTRFTFSDPQVTCIRCIRCTILGVKV